MNNTVCEVRMDGEKYESNDFVCVMADEEKGARMLYHTDALTLGMAAQLTFIAYQKELAKLPEEDQKAVLDALNTTGGDDTNE